MARGVGSSHAERGELEEGRGVGRRAGGKDTREETAPDDKKLTSRSAAARAAAAQSFASLLRMVIFCALALLLLCAARAAVLTAQTAHVTPRELSLSGYDGEEAVMADHSAHSVAATQGQADRLVDGISWGNSQGSLGAGLGLGAAAAVAAGAGANTGDASAVGTSAIGLVSAKADVKSKEEKQGSSADAASPFAPAPAAATVTKSEDAAAQRCYIREQVEYEGAVAIWGSNNLQPDAGACCESCRKQRESSESSGNRAQACVLWVYCGAAEGCGTQKHGECWGKTGPATGVAPPVRAFGPGVAWTSGAVFSESEAAAVAVAEAAAAAAERMRRERPGNPRVFFDIEINGEAAGRIEFVLYAFEAPRAAENFRAMCTGERGGKKTFKKMRFYRIIDRFIDQAGVHGVNSIWDSAFDDDPGGLKLNHDKPGLLSAANMGPDTNSGHFSIVVAPAPHLNGGYTIFGEVIKGIDVVDAINKLTEKGTDRVTGHAVVSDSGCLANCEPRNIGPKCQTRAESTVPVQGRPVRPCLD